MTTFIVEPESCILGLSAVTWPQGEAFICSIGPGMIEYSEQDAVAAYLGNGGSKFCFVPREAG